MMPLQPDFEEITKRIAGPSENCPNCFLGRVCNGQTYPTERPKRQHQSQAQFTRN